ncbi:hypothetical protein [Lysinibacillus endophyticus]|uniref:hypothetical protein n=1 Tax=Ureibacillus endophyticus TaxID=1978490 RepID=UPI0020A047EC|nr:hypothetical protein [Lysinibacillus endophyticus]MCP1146796.1 hypothetical protein [Lysinibacillus endophyticus]
MKKVFSSVLLGLSLTLPGALIASAEEMANNRIGNVHNEISQNSGVITPNAVHERWVSGIEKVYTSVTKVESQIYYRDGDWAGILNLVSTKPGYNPLTGRATVIGVYEGWIHPR